MSESKIRVGSQVKKIEVNDEGDYIIINAADLSLLDRYSDMLQWFQDKQTEMDTLDAQVEAAEEGSLEEKVAVLRQITNISKECGERIDLFFGPGTCEKVFHGVTAPDGIMLAEFFEQITPIIQEAFQERHGAVSGKYSRNRRGSK